jgi:HEAT repeat protein
LNARLLSDTLKGPKGLVTDETLRELENQVSPETLMKLEPGKTTAEELIAELKSDPVWLAAREEEERERRRKQAEWRQAEAPLVDELREAGFQVDSAWDLVNTSTPYPEALPILLEHLERPYPDRVREGIARALAVRDAKFGWETLTRLFRQEEAGTDAKDGLAVAIAAVADDDVFGDLIALARETTHGESRILLLSALARSQDPQARSALKELEADPELATEVRRIFRRMK